MAFQRQSGCAGCSPRPEREPRAEDGGYDSENADDRETDVHGMLPLRLALGDERDASRTTPGTALNLPAGAPSRFSSLRVLFSVAASIKISAQVTVVEGACGLSRWSGSQSLWRYERLRVDVRELDFRQADRRRVGIGCRSCRIGRRAGRTGERSTSATWSVRPAKETDIDPLPPVKPNCPARSLARCWPYGSRVGAYTLWRRMRLSPKLATASVSPPRASTYFRSVDSRWSLRRSVSETWPCVCSTRMAISF